MTASIYPDTGSTAASSAASSARFAGVRALARKDLAEWRRSRRVWVVLGATTLFMALAAANGWINTWALENVPGAQAPDAPISMDPLPNILAAVGSQIFVLAGIFATMGLLVAERERGTLAWVASKPVSAGSIWISKWLTASLVVAIVAGVVPLAVTVGLASILYDVPAVGTIAAIAAGVVAGLVFYAAVTLAASTVTWNQAAVAAIGFIAFIVPGVVAGLLPVNVEPFLPTAILGWTIGLASGADVGFVTPVAWMVGVVALVAFATWRMGRIEL